MQTGHLLLQLLHCNSLHLALAKQYGRNSVLALWGALKKIPQRLLEALRYFLLPEVDFDVKAAVRCHISLNSSKKSGCRWAQVQAADRARLIHNESGSLPFA